MTIRLDILGAPVPQARPRFSTRGGFAKAYKAASQKEAESLFQAAVTHQLRQCGHTAPIPAGEALRVTCVFYMPVPKGATKKFRLQCIAKAVYHTKKPDTDNLIKFVKDCLNGLAWHDDNQVAIVSGTKIYSDQPRTVVLIETLSVDVE